MASRRMPLLLILGKRARGDEEAFSAIFLRINVVPVTFGNSPKKLCIQAFPSKHYVLNIVDGQSLLASWLTAHLHMDLAPLAAR